MSMIIALDAMGGDHGADVVVPAAIHVLKENPELKLILVGDGALLEKQLQQHHYRDAVRLSIQHTSQKVEMDELPSSALRNKKDSSMRVSINLVKEKRAQACVSAGNTGALMATARYVLKTLPGIDRPALIFALPTINGHSHILDLGANVDSTAEQLFQFALMGSELVSAVNNLTKPRVALLNVGEEEMKGSEVVKEAAQLIAASDLNYIGFVEGDDIYRGTADVVVCDGFVGNVALKTSEGVAMLIRHFMQQELNHNLWRKFLGLMMLPALRSLRAKIDPRRYNGASLVGLQGIVIKSHGGADILAFSNAIKVACKEVEQALPDRISSHLEQAFLKRQQA